MSPSPRQHTDLTAGTLAPEDREAFLRASGISRMDAATAARLRDDWPDELILIAMEMGAA